MCVDVCVVKISIVATHVVVSGVRHQQIVDYHRRQIVTGAAPFIVGSVETIKVFEGERTIELQFNIYWFARCPNTGRITARQRHTPTGFNSV